MCDARECCVVQTLDGLGTVFPHLRVVDVSHNALASLAPLADLPALERVAADGNRIVCLNGLGHGCHPALMVLSVGNNNLPVLRVRSA